MDSEGQDSLIKQSVPPILFQLPTNVAGLDYVLGVGK